MDALSLHLSAAVIYSKRKGVNHSPQPTLFVSALTGQGQNGSPEILPLNLPDLLICFNDEMVGSGLGLDTEVASCMTLSRAGVLIQTNDSTSVVTPFPFRFFVCVCVCVCVCARVRVRVRSNNCQ